MEIVGDVESYSKGAALAGGNGSRVVTLSRGGGAGRDMLTVPLCFLEVQPPCSMQCLQQI
jgi:hypothetical protein